MQAPGFYLFIIIYVFYNILDWFCFYIYHLLLINDSNTSILNFIYLFFYTKSCNFCSVPVYISLIYYTQGNGYPGVNCTITEHIFHYFFIFAHLLCLHVRAGMCHEPMNPYPFVSIIEKYHKCVCKMPLITAIAWLSATTLSSRARAKLLNKFWSSVNGF